MDKLRSDQAAWSLWPAASITRALGHLSAGKGHSSWATQMGSLLEGCRDSSQNQGSRGSLGAVRLWGAAELCFCPAAVGSTPGGGGRGWVAQTRVPWRPLRRGGGVPQGVWSSCWPAWDGPRQLQAASSLWWEQRLPGTVKAVPCCQNPDCSPTRQQRGLRAISEGNGQPGAEPEVGGVGRAQLLRNVGRTGRMAWF